MISETHFVVARNDWHAGWIMKFVNEGRYERDKVLFPSVSSAQNRINRMRLIDRAKFKVFKIEVKK